MKNKILKLLISTLTISALIGIYIIIAGESNSLTTKIISTTSSIFAFSIPGLCCSAIYDKHKKFSTFGILSSLVGSIFLILIIWGLIDIISTSFEYTIKILVSLITIAISTGHISLMLLINNNSLVNKIRNYTIYLSIVLNFILLTTYWEIIDYSGFFIRIILIIIILIVLGTIITPILNNIHKKTKNSTI